jgi:Mg-chelatase subunit ChlD
LAPSWLISIVIHGALAALCATITLTVAAPSQEQPFTVGIMVKRQSEHGVSMESNDTTFEERTDRDQGAAKFVANVEPGSVADALPKLPEIDLSTIGLSGSTLAAASELLTVPDSGGASSLAATVSTQFFGAQVWGTKFVYVIDRSGSMMQRDRIGAAKRELLASLAQLPDETQFQIVFYNTEPSVMLPSSPAKLQFATDHNKLRAAREVEQVIPTGGTEHLPALQLALTLQPDVVLFLTDADDLRPQDVAAATALNKDRARIHTVEFGVGAATDEQNQLRELANRNGGSYRYIDAANLDRRHSATDR